MSRVQDTADTISNATDGIRDKAADVQQNLSDIGNKVRDAASQSYGQVRDQATDYINQGKQAAEEWEQSLESYVQEKPLQAVLIAAGVGMLVGLLWRRH